MKSLNYNFLAIFILLIALVQAPLFGQSAREMVRDDIPAFSCIELGGDFALDIRYGKQYKVQLVELHDIEKQNGHPSISGMKSICDQLIEAGM